MVSGIGSVTHFGASFHRIGISPNLAVTAVALLALAYLPTAQASSMEVAKKCFEGCVKNVGSLGYLGVGGCAIFCGLIGGLTPG